MGAAAELDRWFVGGCGFAGLWLPEEESFLEEIQPLMCATGVVAPALGAAAELGGWFVWLAVFSVCGDFQRRRQHSATTAHRALPVCEWPALGIP